MTVKEVSSIILHNQHVCVWNTAQRVALFEGINEDIPESLYDLPVKFINSSHEKDTRSNIYYDEITIFIQE